MSARTDSALLKTWPTWIAVLGATLLARTVASGQLVTHCSTETDFVATDGPHAGQTISLGDELHDLGRVVSTNFALTGAFCPMPPHPDVGLDALHRRHDGTVLFSTEIGWFDECLGQQISNGDLLAGDGLIVMTNGQLMRNFHPMPPVPDVGLDAVHELPNGEFYFSTESDIFDEQLGTMLRHGDLLSDGGRVVMTNAQLLRNFHPMPPTPRVGLDAVFPPPGFNEIWFSTEQGWFDELLGVHISDGDLLSDAGYVVRSNGDLLGGFFFFGAGPAVGLDALWISDLVRFESCGTLVQGVTCILLQIDDGRRYALHDTGALQVGDRVWVKGALDPQCATACLEGDGCIEDNTIGPCFEECGVLAVGPQGCIRLLLESGDWVWIENLGGFNIGDRIWVTGERIPQSFLCPPLTRPGVEDNTVQSCPACFEGCGWLVQGAECILFQADAGGLFAVQNQGGFHVDDRVFVKGCLNTSCVTICQQGDGCIEHNTIERCCCCGDINGDGRVDRADIAPFVQVLLGLDVNPCRAQAADVDLSGAADGGDVAPFVVAILL